MKIDGRPGNAGLTKGTVRAVRASTHKLGVAVIGEAGNWCGAHTQTFSGMQYFGEKKFRDEVALWTQVTSDFMAVDRAVYDVSWSKLNAAIRALGAQGLASDDAVQGMLGNVADIFEMVERYDFAAAEARLEKETEANLALIAPEGYVFDPDDADDSENGEFLSVYKALKRVERMLAAKAE